VEGSLQNKLSTQKFNTSILFTFMSNVPFYSGLKITHLFSTLIKERICLLCENIAHFSRCPPASNYSNHLD
jgi:hypothetical protein